MMKVLEDTSLRLSLPTMHWQKMWRNVGSNRGMSLGMPSFGPMIPAPDRITLIEYRTYSLIRAIIYAFGTFP